MIPNGSLRKVLCLQPPSRKPIIKMVINYVESSKMIFFIHLPTTVKKKLTTKTTPMESFYGQVTRLASASAKASWLKLASVGGGGGKSSSLLYHWEGDMWVARDANKSLWNPRKPLLTWMMKHRLDVVGIPIGWPYEWIPNEQNICVI